MSELSIVGELTLVQLGFTMMARKYAKKRESWGMAAIYALERVIGDGEDWTQMGAYAIQMMGAGYPERQVLYDQAMDLLHDIMCELFPECDDNVRYVKTGGAS